MARLSLLALLLMGVAGCPEEGDGGGLSGGAPSNGGGGGGGSGGAQSNGGGGGGSQSNRYCIYTHIHFTHCPGLFSDRDEEERCIAVDSDDDCPPPPEKGSFDSCSHTYVTVEQEVRTATSCEAATAARERERCHRLGEGACGMAECTDGIDNNDNGLVDCQEPACLFSGPQMGLCLFPERSPGRCFNQHDDDGDGRSDCFDPDCAGVCAAEEGLQPSSCLDFGPSGPVDNDGDGLANCEEWVCYDPRHYTPPCYLESEICDDYADNDGDGDHDCSDSDCSDLCRSQEGYSAPTCQDGIDNDEDGLIDCAEPQCLAHPGAWGCARPEICDDGIDNDRDRMYDAFEDDEDCPL